MNPSVSLIVPVYKVPEKYLRQCIESCINQTLKDIEIIIVHDMSDDNCGVICDEYASEDKRISVIHKNDKINSGLSAARNIGVRNASGNWIMFVDGDDWIEKNTCEKMLQIAKSEHPDIVLCAVCKDYGERIERFPFPFSDFEVFDKEGCKDLQARILDFNSYIACVYAKLIKKEYLIDHSIYHDEELKNGVEGLEFNVRLFEKINKAIFTKSYYYHYMYNDKSLSAFVSDKTNKLIIIGFSKIKDFIERTHNEALKSRFDNRVHYAIITAAISGYFNPANKITYHERVAQFKTFLNNELIKTALKKKHTETISGSRAIALWLIKHRCYFALSIMAKARYKQRHS